MGCKGARQSGGIGPSVECPARRAEASYMELNLEPAGNDTISLHPAVLARYQEQLVELQDALSEGINAGDSDAPEAIRGLVETVTVLRDPRARGRHD